VNIEIGAQTNVQRAKRLNIALLIVQGSLMLTFVGGGIWKLVTPVQELAMMIPWAGQVPTRFLYATAIFDIFGGVGVLLPYILRVPRCLAVAAALGCAALQASAIIFHCWRGEAVNTPFNFLVLALSLFVAWGRRSEVHCRTMRRTSSGSSG
jgi:uncharacterized membrane protein YphA (DoxX/SURF4 family)